MININELNAGMRASFIHFGTVETVGERDGKLAPEWLQEAFITRRGVFSGNIADEATYSNFMRKENPKYKSKGKAWFRHHPEQAGVVLHKQTDKPYLCVLHPRTTKAEYFVDGKPATAEQVETIRAFKKNRGHGKFAVYDLDKVTCEGYIETEEDEIQD